MPRPCCRRPPVFRASEASHAATAEDARRSLGRLLGYLRPYRLSVAVVGLLVLAFTALSIVGPYIMGRAIDRDIIGRDPVGLVRSVGQMVVVYTAMWLAGASYGRLMASVAQKAMRKLRQDLFDHMQVLPMRFYEGRSTGDLMSRLTNDTDAIGQLLAQNLVAMMSSVVALVGVLGAMFVLNAWLALASLIVIPIMFGLVGLLMKRIGPAFRDQQASLGALNGLMEENLSGQRVVIAYGRQGAALAEFDAGNATARTAGVRANILAGIIPPMSMMLSNLNVVVVAGAGAAMAIAGVAGVTIGLIATFTDYTRRVGQPLMQIANLFSTIVAALAGAERIFEVMDAPAQDRDLGPRGALGDVRGEVVFEDVDFGYAPGEPVLKGVSLVARPGETIALVGPTGAGKTTIVNVLSRFYRVDGGRILIDGRDIGQVSQDSLRRQLGIVLQDTYLFSESVMENIRYGRLDATDADVVAAAVVANADGFIRRLPDGYDTVLSERGSTLSQGQRQLLAIARAVLADPRILILDEATSSVDTRTERQIQDALLALMAGRTSFVIAHRLSTIQGADQILVIDGGRIVERGTHAALLEAGGAYHALYTSQFKGRLDPAA